LRVETVLEATALIEKLIAGMQADASAAQNQATRE
jgi:hypothetical protein